MGRRNFGKKAHWQFVALNLHSTPNWMASPVFRNLRAMLPYCITCPKKVRRAKRHSWKKESRISKSTLGFPKQNFFNLVINSPVGKAT